MSASNDLDSSVMVSSIQEFHNPNYFGATMKMNAEAIDYVRVSLFVFTTRIVAM